MLLKRSVRLNQAGTDELRKERKEADRTKSAKSSVEKRGKELEELIESTDALANDSQTFLVNTTRLSQNLKTRTSWLGTIVNVFVEAFLETYGFDGYDVIKHGVATKHGIQPFSADELSEGLMAASFFGFPSRLDDDKKFSGIQFLRGLIGGWSPVKRDKNKKPIWTEKHRWQILAIPVKFLIILPLKILTLPFKLLINIAKIFTELLPTLLQSATESLFPKLRNLVQITYHNEKILPLNYLGAFLLGVLTALTGLVYVLSRVAKIIGRILTSPEKSIRIAYHLDIESFLTGPKSYNKPLIKYLAVFSNVVLAIASFMLSMASWIIAFPVVIGAAVAYFPFVLQAATWVSQLPVISHILAFIQPIFALAPVTAYSFLSLTLMSSLGLQISTSLFTFANALGWWAGLIAPALTKATDYLSNKWALSGWDSKVGILSTIASLRTPAKTDSADIDLADALRHDPSPSKKATQLAGGLNVGDRAAANLEDTGRRVESRSLDNDLSSVPARLEEMRSDIEVLKSTPAKTY